MVIPSTMLRKWCTFVVLALAVTPFTAPFRTCDPQPISSPVLVDENDLVAARTTEAGRLKIAPAIGIVVVSLSVAAPPVTFITPSVAPTIGITDRSILSTILRL